MTNGNTFKNDEADEDFALKIAEIQPRLYGFILKRLVDRDQTLEVLQRTNLVLCRKATEFQSGSSFPAWAFTIAKFQVMAWRKAEGRSKLLFTDQVYELIDRAPAVEVDAVDVRIPILRQCLEKLRSIDRSLVQSRYRDDLSRSFDVDQCRLPIVVAQIMRSSGRSG